MTGWIRRVYKAVKQSGAERELAIRIPAGLDTCRSIGLDAEEWMRQGLVDVLIGETFASRRLVDPTVDFRPLVTAAKGSNCRIHASLNNVADSDRLGSATIELIRATACNYWAQGVDGLYLAHWFTTWPYGPLFYEQIRELPHPDVMAAKDKFYRVPSKWGSTKEAPGADYQVPMQLPVDVAKNAPVIIILPVSDDLERWDRMGRVYELLLRVKLMAATEHDKFRFKFNEKELPGRLMRKIDHTYMMVSPRHRSHSGYWFIFKLDREYWPTQGNNNLELTLLERLPEAK